MQPQAAPDSDRGAAEIRALDCNLSALCDHIQVEGFNGGAFSDVVVHAMGSTYHLHRLILSRSSYFRNMLHGPWKEAAAPSLTLQIDDDNVNLEAIEMALAYLYGHYPKLNDNNAFRVLAAASFLDLEDLCTLCTDFIISELWTSNFLAYQIFAEKQDYGMHGERVRKACWGYLCQCGTMELREVLPKLSSQTLHALLTSDRLWVSNEEKRFELALYTLLSKATLLKEEEQARLNSESGYNPSHDPSAVKGKQVIEECNVRQQTISKFEQFSIGNSSEGQKPARNILVEFADCVVDFQNNLSYSKPAQVQPLVPSFDPYSCNVEQSASADSSFSNANPIQASSSYSSVQNIDADRIGINSSATEGPSEESACYHIGNNIWLSGEQSGCFSADRTSSNAVIRSETGNSGTSSSWGARTIGTRQDNVATVNPDVSGEDYEAFVNIFEGGSLLYCNMSFEALLNVRKQLEDLGFPCKAVNDGLWLQTLLSHRLQEIGADTCRNCSFTSISCACQQPYGYSQRSNSVGYYRQELDRNSESGNLGNVYLADAQGEGAGMYGPVRVHVRGPIDGLAGIGRGTTFVSGSAWPPTRFVFSRVPFGMGSRNCQHTLANEESGARVDVNGDLSGDGLTALVGSSQGGGNTVPVHMEHTERAYVPGPATVPNANDLPVQMLDSQEHSLGLGWENTEVSSISLDLKTPLRHFPPFRFGVEFEDVLRLGDGQVKHSPDVFYAGSLWKVSVQAFNDEDPQGRRTLGLFLHRRKADPTDSLQKVHMYVDSREKVTARYQLICPSKREIMVFGSLRQPGTLLPKAPKGWGWRTALLFDELPDLLQSGALRVAAVVQLI